MKFTPLLAIPLVICLVGYLESRHAKGHLAQWLTDLPQAQALAQGENKMVLINFTGSDWCEWCIRLKKEVYSTPAFLAYAQSNLVLVEIDFPQKKSLGDQVQLNNQSVAEAYQVQDFPTAVLLNRSGHRLGQVGYVPGGPEAFLTQLQKIGSRSPLILVQSAPITGQPDVAQVHLKGISGSSGRRLALINSTTLAVGESAIVKTDNGRIRVRCIQIFENEVIVSLNDSPEIATLRLNGHP